LVFAGDQEQFSLERTGTLSTYGEQRNNLKTKTDGTFAFPSRVGGRRVFAGHPTGWANVSTEDWPPDGRITLAPWGQLSGVLLDSMGKPVSNIRLTLQVTWQRQEGDPWVNFQEQPETDKEGRFAFQKVPPGQVSLIRLVPMSANSWTHAPQTNLVVQPGAKIDLGRMTMKSAP